MNQHIRGSDMLNTIIESQGVRVVATCNGTFAESPVMVAEKAHRLYDMLAGLGDDRLAVIQLTALRIYQVCNS